VSQARRSACVVLIHILLLLMRSRFSLIELPGSVPLKRHSSAKRRDRSVIGDNWFNHEPRLCVDSGFGRSSTASIADVRVVDG